jgi:hypothetical protein
MSLYDDKIGADVIPVTALYVSAYTFFEPAAVILLIILASHTCTSVRK